MKKLIVIAAMSACGAFAADKNDWENPEVNSINRLPARTYAMPLADESAALSDALVPETPYAVSLNGEWKFRWVGDPARRPAGFHEVGFDDSKWTDFPVPDGPTLANVSPFSTEKLSPSSTTLAPNRLVTFLNSTTVICSRPSLSCSRIREWRGTTRSPRAA